MIYSSLPLIYCLLSESMKLITEEKSGLIFIGPDNMFEKTNLAVFGSYLWWSVWH